MENEGQYYHFTKKATFNAKLKDGTLKNEDIAFIQETNEIWTNGTFYPDLSAYLKSADADKKYLSKTSSKSVINIDDKGALSNLSDNGQAYLAVRAKLASFIIDVPYAGSAFGVKDDGTTAFSHKTYTTYNASTGKYTGARNTAVLQFAGETGLRYAKNTSTGTDVTQDMYRYVGVIDSPDEFQRVYSAKQVDDIISGLTAQIQNLQDQIDELKNNS